MKKILLIFLFCCNFLLIFCSTSEAQQKIRISYFDVPPFIFYDANENKLTGGAIYDFLGKHIGPIIGVEFVWDRSPSSIPRQLISIRNGSTDAIALLSYTPQRAKKMLFTATPFFISSPGIAILKSNRLSKVDRIEDILPLRIGYGHNIYITPFMQDKRINFDLVGSANYNELNFKKLMISRIDAVYTPDLASLLAVAKELKLENEVRVIKLPDKVSANHVVFANNLRDVSERYNEAFEQIDGVKTFMKIMNRYINSSMLR